MTSTEQISGRNLLMNVACVDRIPRRPLPALPAVSMRTPEKNSHRARPVLALVLLTSLAAGGCGGSAVHPEGYLTTAPLPENVASIDPEVRARVRARARRVDREPSVARSWGDLGMLYEVVGLRAQAIVCYEQAQLREPDEPKWWYRSAVCRGRMDDVRTALAEMDRVIALEPGYGPAHHRRGTFALEDGDLETAWSSFESCIAVAPDFTGGWTGLAHVHLQRDENDDAVRVLERLHDRDPADELVSKLLESAYRQARVDKLVRRPAAGVESDDRFWSDPWQSELRAFRRAPQAHRITRLLQSGKTVPVIRKLERRRKAEPDNLEFLPELAEAYFQAGRVGEARRTYESILERAPENVGACMALGRFFEVDGKFRQALPWYDRAIEIDPTSGQAVAARGRILFEGEQYQPAITTLERALALDQRDVNLYLWLGKARTFVDDWTGAVRDLGLFLEQTPDDPDALLWLAKAHLKLGELDQAATEVARVRALGAANVGMLDQIEVALERALARQKKKGRPRRSGS